MAIGSFLHDGDEWNWDEDEKLPASGGLVTYNWVVATQIFSEIFTPILGEMIQVDSYFFQLGWFNHQPGIAYR